MFVFQHALCELAVKIKGLLKLEGDFHSCPAVFRIHISKALPQVKKE